METRYRNTGAPAKLEENGQKHNNYTKYTNGNCAKVKTQQNGFKKSTLNGHSLKVKSENIFSQSHLLCKFLFEIEKTPKNNYFYLNRKMK